MQPRDSDESSPSLLIVDDERQIHSAIRLRLGEKYQVVSASTPQEGLSRVAEHAFDLCIVDIQMPGMNGLKFVEAARALDPALNYVIFSGFDTDENLRQAIPLHVCEFIQKPLPDRQRFEKFLPEWIQRTRQRRKELSLAKEGMQVIRDLEFARIERDVESTASESAREALFQSATSLTTIHALLLSAIHTLDPFGKSDAQLCRGLRDLHEAYQRTIKIAALTDHYFNSAYADRNTSPASVDQCTKHAIMIASRIGDADGRQQVVDYAGPQRETSLPGLSGLDFLTLLVPLLVQSLAVAPNQSTVRVRYEPLRRLDEATRAPRGENFVWVNRRNALLSSPGLLLSILAHGEPPSESEASAWLRGQPGKNLRTAARGLINGVQKCQGTAAIAVRPEAISFEIRLAVPI